MNLTNCTEKTKVSRIKVEEGKRNAVFLNIEKHVYLKIRVDGCVVKNNLASDWVVRKTNVGDIVIELKGVDVDHALDQILATAKLWKDNNICIGKIGSLVVCKQYPRINTKIQRYMQKFYKEFRMPLRVTEKNSEYVFESLLEF